MDTITNVSRPTIAAQPMEDHAWRVCACDSGEVGFERTIGYIDEVGGTYEVRVLHWPSLRQYVSSFKEAMECFGPTSG